MRSKTKKFKTHWEIRAAQLRILEYSKRWNDDYEEFITLLASVPSKNISAVEITEYMNGTGQQE